MPTPKTIFHVDMDAFFAAVEIRDQPQLRGKPVLVGGTGRRGVVSAASYEARAFGCRSAQPMAEARRKCPQAVVLPGRYDVYCEVSRQIFDVFAEFSPAIEGLSIDEAFLDMTGTDRLHGPPRKAAERLQQRVAEVTCGLTCSVGIASAMFLAKIASGFQKPHGITEILPGGEIAFLDALAIGQLWGVGPKTEKQLREHGLTKVGDLRRIPVATLERWFGHHGVQLHRLANGIDEREITTWRERKQVSHEDTYEDDIVGEAHLRECLLGQATRVADRLIVKGLQARRIQLKLRDTAFHTQLRQCTLARPTDEARVIYAAVAALLASIDVDGRAFRLTGVGAGELHGRNGPGQQLSLDIDEPSTSQRGHELQHVMSAVRQKFGDKALFPAAARQRSMPSKKP